MPEISKLTELIALRVANSKTYDLGNGKRQLVISIGDVHYKDNYANKAELWKDIDLTWEGNRITKAPYELTHEGNKLTLRNKRTGNTTTIELLDVGGKKIPDVAWERSKGLTRAPGITTIEDVALDTDLEVIAEFSAVRFRRVLKSDKAPLEAKFKITGDTSLVVVRASDEEGRLPVEWSLKDGILSETLKPDRPIKYPVRIDPTWQVGTGTDDTHRRLTPALWYLDHDSFTFGATTFVSRAGGGMRFTNITIPQGAVIDEAYLRLRCDLSTTGSTVRSRISAEDIDNPATFADNSAAFDARWANRTTARVDWDNLPSWTKGTYYNSPEIKTVIKEIVDRGGWNSGQAMVIFLEDYDDRSSHIDYATRYVSCYEESSAVAPRLVIEWSPPLVVAPTVTTQAVTDIGFD